MDLEKSFAYYDEKQISLSLIAHARFSLYKAPLLMYGYTINDCSPGSGFSAAGFTNKPKGFSF